jgi:hypothetical protein
MNSAFIETIRLRCQYCDEIDAPLESYVENTFDGMEDLVAWGEKRGWSVHRVLETPGYPPLTMHPCRWRATCPGCAKKLKGA